MEKIIFVVLLVVGIIFATQNDMLVDIRMYGYVLEGVTLYSVMLSSILAGFIAGTVYSYIDSIKIKSKLRNEKKLRKELEQELENLRTLPLTTSSDMEDSEEFLSEEEAIIKAIE